MFFTPMLSYLSDLEMHNNRTWFHETHNRYEKVRKDFETFTAAIAEQVCEVCPHMADRIQKLPTKRFIYRTARDMRYAAGKPPYKTWFACAVGDEGREKTSMSYYVQIAPQNRSEICVGVWFMDNRKMTERVRRYISEHGEEFAQIMSDDLVRSWFCGDSVSRTPKGFSSDDPMIEYIKYKQWMLACNIKDEDLTDMDSVVAYCRSVFEKMEPFRAFFDRAVRFARLPEAEEIDEAQAEDTKEVTFWPIAKSADEWDF